MIYSEKWLERMWWLVIATHTLGAIVGFANGEFWRSVTALGIAAMAGVIIMDERKIRRLRASKTVVLYSSSPVFRSDEWRRS